MGSWSRPPDRTRHGHHPRGNASRTYKAWQNARARCFNPRHHKYADYGGRGITMCAAWNEDFAVFLADMGECPPDLTLERIEVDGDYKPGNCRWATNAEQQRNRRGNIWVEYEGQRMILKDCAAAAGVGYHALKARYRRSGQPLDEAIAALRLTASRSPP